jgi:hypothetical protein
MRYIDAFFFRATAAFRARGAVPAADLYYTPFDFGLITSIDGCIMATGCLQWAGSMHLGRLS